MRLNTWVTLGASAAFGLMAVFLARGWIDEAIESEFQQAVPVVADRPVVQLGVPVVVAAQDFAFGDVITLDTLKIVEFPEEAVPLGHFTSLEELLVNPELRTIAMSRISANEAVVDHRISGPGARGSLSALITPGMRAVSVRIDDVAGVGGFIVPGDHVDVVLTKEVNGGRGRERAGAKTFKSEILMRQIKVMGIDQNLDVESAVAQLASTATLEVTNEQAVELSRGMEQGRLSLNLRRAGELDTQLPKAQKAKSNSYAAARHTKKKKTSDVTSVTVFRGETVDQVSVVKEGEAKSGDTTLAGG